MKLNQWDFYDIIALHRRRYPRIAIGRPLKDESYAPLQRKLITHHFLDLSDASNQVMAGRAILSSVASVMRALGPDIIKQVQKFKFPKFKLLETP